MNQRTGCEFGYVFPVLIIQLLAALQVGAQTITPSPYWKNQVVFPDDPFRIAGASAEDPGWVKFTILLELYDPNIVYFQDCQKYTFHFTFATECLDPFLGMSTSEYEEITMYEVDQQAILGTDGNDKVLSINKAAGTLLGVSIESAEGRMIQEIVRNSELQQFVENVLYSDLSLEADIF